MEITKLNYKKHVFVCCNNREEGECCSNVGGEEIYYKLKKIVNENGLTSSVYITRTKCLGFCNNKGTTIVIYPEGKWFLKVKEEEIDNIINCINS